MAIKRCWATNRRGSSLKGVMKLKEIGHDQSPVGVTLLDQPWIIPGRQSPQVSRHINRVQGLEAGKQGHLQKDKENRK